MSAINVTWDNLEGMVRELMEDITQSNIEFTKIIGVARGGCVPAVMLSNRLNIPFESILWQTRDGKYRNEQRLNQLVSNETALIVDDIYDTGKTYETMHSVIAPWNDVHWLSLISKKEDDFLDFVSRKLYNNTDWIVFPWE